MGLKGVGEEVREEEVVVRRLLMNYFLLLCGDVSQKLEIQKIQKSKRWRTRDQRPCGLYLPPSSRVISSSGRGFSE